MHFFSHFFFSASGFQTGIKRKREEEDDGDLNIDGDDSEEYGKPQYPIKLVYPTVSLVHFSVILVSLSVKLVSLSVKLVSLSIKLVSLSVKLVYLCQMGFLCQPGLSLSIWLSIL